MRRTRTDELRREVMCAAGAVLALSVALWVASLWGIRWEAKGGESVLLSGGWVMAVDMGYPQGPAGWHMRRFHWPLSWPEGVLCEWTARRKIVWVPLWIPAYAAALVLVPMWLVGRSRRRKHPGVLCPSCAYDLTSITGPCPECGSEREP
jgi:hypothetical protein